MMTKVRHQGRFPYKADLHSHELPNFKAQVLDLSEGGARIRLKPGELRQGSVFGFASFLSSQVNSPFKGNAKIAWIRETMDGMEAGVEWQDLTGPALRALRSALLKAGQ